jgi:hypothetical protein
MNVEADAYLCDDCFEELVALGPGTDIEKFFDTPPRRYLQKRASRAFFDALFPMR